MTSSRLFLHPLRILTLTAVLLAAGASLPAADQPQWGRRWSRSLVSEERDLPDTFDPKTGKNILWTARLGTETHSTPIIADGRVYVGTNNGDPRDPKHQGDRGVLMCFDEKDGHLLWQLVVPKREEDRYLDWPKSGISSPVTVEGDRVYVVSNRGEVLCLDARGLANGNDGPFREEGAHYTPRGESAPAQPLAAPGPLDADILWIFDLTKEAGIWSHDSAHSSILIHGNYLYLNTGTGVDHTHRKIRTPDAPSLVVLDKRTGRYVARDDEHIAPNIFHCTWSSPAMADVHGRPLVFFAGGNGIVYAFEPVAENAAASTNSPDPVARLKKIWQFDFDPAGPKTEVHRFTTNRLEGPSNIYGLPVFHDGRLYVAGGGDLFWGKNEAWLKCIDATQTGDITRDGLIWSYALQKHVFGTPVVHAGLIYLADCGRTFHCIEAATGRPVWTHEINGEVWASPLVADDKVYLGTRSGAFYVFATGREKRLLSETKLDQGISATTTAANGALYIATMTQLYAVRKDAK